jgi:thioredoxin 1
MGILQITGSDIEIQFAEKVLLSKEPVLVEFYKNYSGLSFLAESLLQEFTDDFKDKVLFYKVNLDEHPFFELTYSILEIPTILLFKDGTVSGSVSGPFSKSLLVAAIFDKV